MTLVDRTENVLAGPDAPPDDVMMTPGEVAALFDVTPKTVGRWDAAGVLVAVRTPGGHRRFPATRVYELFSYLSEVGEA